MVSYGRCVNNCPISVCVGILSSSDGSLYIMLMDIGGGFVCGGFNLAVVLYLLCMFLRVGILLVVLSLHSIHGLALVQILGTWIVLFFFCVTLVAQVAGGSFLLVDLQLLLNETYCHKLYYFEDHDSRQKFPFTLIYNVADLQAKKWNNHLVSLLDSINGNGDK